MEEKKFVKASSALFGSSVSLTTFWVLNIFKETFEGFKSFLNFYPPIGPLLGLFLFSILGFWVAFITALLLKIKGGRVLSVLFLGSAVLFSIMVFPPVFEPIVNMLRGK